MVPLNVSSDFNVSSHDLNAEKSPNSEPKSLPVPSDPATIFGTNSLQFPQAKKLAKES